MGEQREFSIALIAAGLLAAGLLAAAGCASAPSKLNRGARLPAASSRPADAGTATRPANLVELSFNQIALPPLTPTTRAATQATTAPAPIEAIAIFVEARAAMLRGQRFTA